MLKKGFIFLLVFFIALCLFSAKAFLTNQKKTTSKTPAAKVQEINITIIEGWRITDLAGALESKGIIKASTFLKAAQDVSLANYDLLASRPAKASLEGYVFPDTYRMFKPQNLTDEIFGQDLIKKALDNFEQKFTQEMIAQAKRKNFTLHQIITLASVIEKETGRNAVTEEQKSALDLERKNVASIFYNRLKAGMPLESDATVNYTTGKNNPTPTQAELDTISPYNTYLNKGLPPGPICNPSLSSIMTALYPAQTDYYFFLHIQPSGEPIFSKTFEEHVKNKFKYLK